MKEESEKLKTGIVRVAEQKEDLIFKEAEVNSNRVVVQDKLAQVKALLNLKLEEKLKECMNEDNAFDLVIAKFDEKLQSQSIQDLGSSIYEEGAKLMQDTIL